MRMALEGIRVLDWTQYTAGPAATMILAGLGADVIHLEMPGSGDLCRGSWQVYGVNMKLAYDHNEMFENYNRNKKSVTLNLASENGREILYRLVKKSDVFVTNFLPSRRKQFQVEYDDLKKYNPLIIYGVNSICGSKGPDANIPGMDILGQAKSGVMMNVGQSNEIPLQATPGLGDIISANSLAFSVVTALLARERLGIGQEIEVSQLGSLISVAMYCPISYYLNTGKTPEPFIRHKAKNPLTSCYKCKDSRWVMLSGNVNKHWAQLAEMLGKPSLAEEPRFATLEDREKNNLELISILERSFALKDSADWVDLARKMSFPLCLVNCTEDLEHDPQVIANEYIVENKHPLLGKLRFQGYPFKMRETPFIDREPAPELGQHTEEVLINVGGYNWDDISRLKEEGTI